MTSFWRGIFCLLLVMAGNYTKASNEISKINKSANVQSSVDSNEAASQQNINNIAAQTRTMYDEYVVLYDQWEKLKEYNDQLEKIVESQRKEKDSIAIQIKKIDGTNKEVVPLMKEMIKRFETLVANDIPFLPKERQGRVDRLKGLMDRADVSYSEKYRQVLEAYQIENQYGQTIETYRDNIAKDGKTIAVDYLRIGRIGFYYQSIDGRDTAYYDSKTKNWVEIDGPLEKDITLGIKVASKKSPLSLLRVSMPAAMEGKVQ